MLKFSSTDKRKLIYKIHRISLNSIKKFLTKNRKFVTPDLVDTVFPKIAHTLCVTRSLYQLPESYVNIKHTGLMCIYVLFVWALIDILFLAFFSRFRLRLFPQRRRLILQSLLQYFINPTNWYDF